MFWSALLVALVASRGGRPRVQELKGRLGITFEELPAPVRALLGQPFNRRLDYLWENFPAGSPLVSMLWSLPPQSYPMPGARYTSPAAGKLAVWIARMSQSVTPADFFSRGAGWANPVFRMMWASSFNDVMQDIIDEDWTQGEPIVPEDVWDRMEMLQEGYFGMPPLDADIERSDIVNAVKFWSLPGVFPTKSSFINGGVFMEVDLPWGRGSMFFRSSVEGQRISGVAGQAHVVTVRPEDETWLTLQVNVPDGQPPLSVRTDQGLLYLRGPGLTAIVDGHDEASLSRLIEDGPSNRDEGMLLVWWLYHALWSWRENIRYSLINDIHQVKMIMVDWMEMESPDLSAYPTLWAAMAAAADWRERMILAENDPAAIVDVRFRDALKRLDGDVELARFSDGDSIIEITTPTSLMQEGASMGHCIGREVHGHPDALRHGKVRVFSYRDAQGVPQATVEMKTSPFVAGEIQGPSNREIDDPLVRVRLAWLLTALRNASPIGRGYRLYSSYEQEALGLPSGYDLISMDGALFPIVEAAGWGIASTSLQLPALPTPEMRQVALSSPLRGANENDSKGFWRAGARVKTPHGLGLLSGVISDYRGTFPQVLHDDGSVRGYRVYQVELSRAPWPSE